MAEKEYVLLTGGNRGFGLDMVKQLTEKGKNVVACCRSTSDELDALSNVVVIQDVDYNQPECVEIVLAGLKKNNVTVIREVYLVAGYFYTGETFENPNWEEEEKMFRICAMSPLHVTCGLVNQGLVGEGAKVCFVTSEGGSLAIQREGGHFGHHSSKAAANMMGRIMALDLKPKGILVVMVHPGFVKTGMTSHYADAYEEFGAITSETAAHDILKFMETASMEDTGRFVAPHGAPDGKGFGMGIRSIEGQSLKPGEDIPW